jgi:hypothetical protein
MSEEMFNAIKKAVQERDEFLEQHPELADFQDRISKHLRECTSTHNKQAMLQDLMLNSLLEIAKVWEGKDK